MLTAASSAPLLVPGRGKSTLLLVNIVTTKRKLETSLVTMALELLFFHIFFTAAAAEEEGYQQHRTSDPPLLSDDDKH